MKKTRGYIALTSVLILSAVFLAIGIGLLSRSITSSQVSISFLAHSRAKVLAESCAEYALIELLRTLNYEGDASILVDDRSCTILPIVREGENGRHIMVEADVDGYMYRQNIYATVGPSKITVVSRENVTQF